MKRSPLPAALLALVAIGLCLPHGGHAADGPVLLSDHFEIGADQTPNGWKNESSGELQVQLAGDPRKPREGKASWRIRVPAWEGGHARVTHAGLPLRADTTYGVAVWLRAEGVEQPVTVSLHRAGRTGESYLSRAFHVGPEWRRCTLEGRCPADDPSAELSISFAGTGTVWVDELRVVQGELPEEPARPLIPKLAKDGSELKPPPPVYQKGNRIYNSSFELGADGWTVPEHVAIVASDSPHGEHFARWLPNPYPLESQPFAVRPGQPYTVSLFLRSQRPGARAEVAAVEVGNGARVAKSFDLTPDWRRYSFTAELPCEQYARYFLMIHPAATLHGLDVDAVQVEEGQQTDYAPAAPVELSTGMKRSQLFPEPNQVIGIPVQVYAPSKTGAELSVQLRLTGFYGQLLDVSRLPLKAGVTRAEVPFRVRMPEQGSIRLEVQALQGTDVLSSAERMLCVLPPLDPNPDPASFFGGHGSVGTAGEWHAPTVAARAGIRWWRLHDLSAYTAWSVAEPARDRFTWYDREVEALRSRGLTVLGVFARTAPWAGSDPGGERSDPSTWPPARMSDFTEYVRRVVGHYRGQISAYEIWNEPWARSSWSGTPDKYVELAKAAAAAARSIDPRVELLGGSLSVPRPQFTDQVLGRGLLNAVDAVSFHEFTDPEAVTFTRGGHDQVTQWSQSLRGKLGLAGGENKALWNTEGGVPCPSYYSWLGAEEQARAAARTLAKTLILSKANGIRRYFYYHVWGEGGGPRLMDWLYADNWALLDYDGGGKPTLGALAGCAQRLEGASHAGRAETEHVRAYLFQKGPDTIVAAWSPTALTEPQLVELGVHPHQVSAYTLMGNQKGLRSVLPVAAGAGTPAIPASVTVSLRDEPTYIVVRNTDPAAVLKALKELPPDAARKPARPTEKQPKPEKPAGKKPKRGSAAPAP